MWSTSSCSRALLCCAVLLATGAVGTAVERTNLPAFTLVRSDATTLASERLVQSGSWALLYVAPECLPCRAILRSLDRVEPQAPGSKLVIVLAGVSAEDLRVELARYPNLANATWLADPSSAMPRSIAEAGVPNVVGLQGRMIEWSVAGVLTDPADVKSILLAWLSRPDQQ